MEIINENARKKAELAVERLTEVLAAVMIFMILLVAFFSKETKEVQILIVITAILIFVTFFIAKFFFTAIYSKEAEKEIYNKILSGVLSPYNLTEICIKDDLKHTYKDFLLELKKIAKFYAKLSPEREHVIIIINFPLYEEAIDFETIRFEEFSRYYYLKDEEDELEKEV